MLHPIFVSIHGDKSSSGRHLTMLEATLAFANTLFKACLTCMATEICEAYIRRTQCNNMKLLSI